MKNIKSITKMTGLTSKALRHWEAVGLLEPQRDENDYRLYSDKDLARIFYIMSLRDFDIPLEQIKAILSEELNEKEALNQHLQRLNKQISCLEKLVEHLSLKLDKGEYQMNETDFALLKSKQLKENEEKYGREIRQKWGDARVEQSYKKYAQADQEKIKQWQESHDRLVQMLEKSYETKDEELADQAILLHKEILELFWPEDRISPEAHINLGQMYVEDERFRANYNQKHEKLPEYFLQAIQKHYK